MSGKKVLGIIGGMGSQASSWMLNRITELSDAQTDQAYLEVILHNNSNIPDRTAAIIRHEESPAPQLRHSLQMLEMCGVEVAMMACMTAYYFYDQIRDCFSGELLHPVDFIARELESNPIFFNKSRIGLIGSTGMLQAKVIPRRLNSDRYEFLTLNSEEQEKYFMDPIYRKDGFKSGCFHPHNLQAFRRQAEILQKAGAEIIIGACSEVPLVMNQSHAEIPFIDAFDLFAHNVVDYCYNKKKQKDVIY